MGGGGARSRSRIAGSGGRAGLLPAATGRVADGAGPMKTTGHVKLESTEAVVHLCAQTIDLRSNLMTLRRKSVPRAIICLFRFYPSYNGYCARPE